jgi:hypothetical protein
MLEDGGRTFRVQVDRHAAQKATKSEIGGLTSVLSCAALLALSHRPVPQMPSTPASQDLVMIQHELIERTEGFLKLQDEAIPSDQVALKYVRWELVAGDCFTPWCLDRRSSQ